MTLVFSVVLMVDLLNESFISQWTEIPKISTEIKIDNQSALIERNISRRDAITTSQQEIIIPQPPDVTGNTILLFKPFQFDSWYGQGTAKKIISHDFSDCPVKCKWSLRKEDYHSAKAVLFEGVKVRMEDLPVAKARNQQWYIYTPEPLVNHLNDSFFLSFFDGIVASYKPDSLGFTPLPTFNYSEMLPLEKRNKTIAAFISNCDAFGGPKRKVYLEELMKYIHIDNYGRCLNTIDSKMAGKRNFTNKMDILKSYKFNLVFENTNLTDYITEKIVHALHAGVVPVYMGAPNVNEFIPHPRSIINVADFNSPKELANYLDYLLKNETAYNEYLEWRLLPQEKLQTPKPNKPRNCVYCEKGWECRLCLRIHRII